MSNYKGKIKPKKKAVMMQEPEPASSIELKRLEAELRKAKLYNEVLEEMLKLTEPINY